MASRTHRRRFLVTTLGSTALLYRWMKAEEEKEAHWAFLSDTHIAEDPADQYRGFRPSDNLRAVVSEIVKTAPSGAVLVGDAARIEGLPGDYQNLRSLLDPIQQKIPVAIALGNTDNRDNFLSQFPDSLGVAANVRDRHIQLIEAGALRYIILDSLLQTRLSSGLLGKAQRMWLARFLGSAESMPTVLFVHHTLDDRDISLLDVDRMFSIIEPHSMVKAIVHGHSHRYHFDAWKGIHLINLPAVAYNFVESEPLGWVEARVTAEGADFKLHATAGNTSDNGKTTSVNWRG